MARRDRSSSGTAGLGSSKAADDIWTSANIITLIRICLVPVFVVALLSPWPTWLGMHDIIDDQVKALVAAGVFILISCTDWIDGYLARSRGQVTNFGKFLDPLADKILVAAALIALVELQVIPSWPVLIILTREFIVSGIRMMAATKGDVIAASWYGKAKTVLQIVAIVLFIVKDALVPDSAASVSNPLYWISWIVMIAALFMTVMSMLDYISKARYLFFPAKDSAPSEEASDGVEARINQLAAQVIDLAKAKGKTLSTAESLTGGLISASLTSVSGSSEVFKGGIASYAISAKKKLLGVDAELLAREGAVDEDVARQMATGCADRFNTNVAVSVTGIAGPTGEEPGKPVGTVFLGIVCDGTANVQRHQFSGSRESVRLQTVEAALTGVKNVLDLL